MKDLPAASKVVIIGGGIIGCSTAYHLAKMGVEVDGVSDVLTLEAGQMRPTPGFGSVIDTEYILGLGTVEERMLILIDIEKLMGSSDMGLIEQSIN